MCDRAKYVGCRAKCVSDRAKCVCCRAKFVKMMDRMKTGAELVGSWTADIGDQDEAGLASFFLWSLFPMTSSGVETDSKSIIIIIISCLVLHAAMVASASLIMELIK